MPRRSPAQQAAIERSKRAAAGRLAPSVPGLSASWAERQQLDIIVNDFDLMQLARLRHPGAFWWWGGREVEHIYGAWCYLCERHVATWARRWPMPDQARIDILKHRDAEHAGARLPVRVQRAGRPLG